MCHSCVACELASRPRASVTPPIRINRRGPKRSTSQPTNGELHPLTNCATEYATDTCARLQPNTLTKVRRNTV